MRQTAPEYPPRGQTALSLRGSNGVTVGRPPRWTCASPDTLLTRQVACPARGSGPRLSPAVTGLLPDAVQEAFAGHGRKGSRPRSAGAPEGSVYALRSSCLPPLRRRKEMAAAYGGPSAAGVVLRLRLRW